MDIAGPAELREIVAAGRGDARRRLDRRPAADRRLSGRREERGRAPSTSTAAAPAPSRCPASAAVERLPRRQSTSSETFYSFASFNRPGRDLPLRQRDRARAASSPSPSSPSIPRGYEVRQVFYNSKDGTRVPMFLVHRRGLDRSAAAADPALRLWRLQRSRAAALPAALDDLGRHGRRARRRQSARRRRIWPGLARRRPAREQAERVRRLHRRGRISDRARASPTNRQLAIEGRSNGGLLVGAVLNQRPDLFAAALPTVGVMDMLRFDRFTAGRYWVDDYGYPDREADFRILRAYSPYHNIRSGVRLSAGAGDHRRHRRPRRARAQLQIYRRAAGGRRRPARRT